VLQVGLSSEVSSTGFEALSKLHHLEQFIFGDECMLMIDLMLETEFLLLCPKILPHLKVAGRHFDLLKVNDTYDDDDDDGVNLNQGYHNEWLQNLHEPATLGLQLLNLCYDFQPNKNIQFPQLEELVLWNPSSSCAISLCDRFAAVSALGLYGCGNSDVLPVLRHVGQRLHSLVLDFVHDYYHGLTISEVLRLCPNLKRFRVSNIYVINEDTGPWPEAAFRCMEEAYFENADLPCGFLKQVNNAYAYI
jgi:hypothetical protein